MAIDITGINLDDTVDAISTGNFADGTGMMATVDGYVDDVHNNSTQCTSLTFSETQVTFSVDDAFAANIKFGSAQLRLIEGTNFRTTSDGSVRTTSDGTRRTIA